MMSLRRCYHRRFGYHERFHIAVVVTIVVVAYVAVPLVAQYITALRGYAPVYYEPKDFERQAWLARHGVLAGLTRIDTGVLVDIVLFVLVAIVWLTVVPTDTGRRSPRPR